MEHSQGCAQLVLLARGHLPPPLVEEVARAFSNSRAASGSAHKWIGSVEASGQFSVDQETSVARDVVRLHEGPRRSVRLEQCLWRPGHKCPTSCAAAAAISLLSGER